MTNSWLNLRFLERDAPCVYCGYNLRGVSITRNCPECGAGACESLIDELLNEILARGATFSDLDDARERIAAELAECPLPAVRLVADAVREAAESHARPDDFSVAAVVPFLRSVAGEESDITHEILREVIADAPRSVTPAMIKRFDDWARQATMA